jgi:hypothetical protein
MRKLRVAFVMIYYPVAMGRYMLDALLRREDVEVWTAGPSSGAWIPWAGGIYLPDRYVFKPDLALPMGGAPTVIYPQLEASKPWEPDVWIEANAALTTIGRPKAPYFVIGTDPHVLDYQVQRRSADVFFCMQSPYMQPKDVFLPYAYAPEWHTPTEIPWEERTTDAALLGLQYTQRTALVGSLRARGRKVEYALGPCYEEARQVYHRTKVGLNWSSMKDTTARCYELMAFGLPAVMNRTPDLLSLFREGEHFLGFSTLDEAVRQAETVLQDPVLGQKLGQQASLAVAPHTWDARMAQVLEVARPSKPADVQLAA